MPDKHAATVKAVIFDWGGVLIDNPQQAIFDYMAARFGIPAERFSTVITRYLERFQVDAITEAELWRRVSGELGVEEPKPSWYSAFASAYVEKPGMFALIEELRERDLKIGFLSNTELPAVDFFNEQDYNFDAPLFSCIEKLVKPDPRIYRLALERLNLTASEAIFIDDKPENCAGAERVGMVAVEFLSEEQVRGDLFSLI